MSLSAFEQYRRPISEIVMRRVKNANLTGFIVEGVSDRKLFERFVDKAGCDLIPVGGREGVLQTLKLASTMNVKGILGLIDSDADLFLGTRISERNVFVTDHTDADTMLFSSDALLAVIVEVAVRSQDRRSAEAIESLGRKSQSQILNAAYPLGVCRRLSAAHRWLIDFEGLNYASFINSVTCTCNLDHLIAQVDKLPRESSVQISKISELLRSELTTERELSHVVRGHDLMSIFAHCSAHLFGKPFSKDEVERMLRLAFGLEHLSKTALYAEIQEWSSRNAPYRVWLG